MEFKADLVEKKLAQYSRKWVNQVSRTEDIIYAKQFLYYRPIGSRRRRRRRRRPGRPLKRLLDGYSLEAETSHLLA
jgi:hypothetical protein